MKEVHYVGHSPLHIPSACQLFQPSTRADNCPSCGTILYVFINDILFLAWFCTFPSITNKSALAKTSACPANGEERTLLGSRYNCFVLSIRVETWCKLGLQMQPQHLRKLTLSLRVMYEKMDTKVQLQP